MCRRIRTGGSDPGSLRRNSGRSARQGVYAGPSRARRDPEDQALRREPFGSSPMVRTTIFQPPCFHGGSLQDARRRPGSPSHCPVVVPPAVRKQDAILVDLRRIRPGSTRQRRRFEEEHLQLPDRARVAEPTTRCPGRRSGCLRRWGRSRPGRRTETAVTTTSDGGPGWGGITIFPVVPRLFEALGIDEQGPSRRRVDGRRRNQRRPEPTVTVIDSTNGGIRAAVHGERHFASELVARRSVRRERDRLLEGRGASRVHCSAGGRRTSRRARRHTSRWLVSPRRADCSIRQGSLVTRHHFRPGPRRRSRPRGSSLARSSSSSRSVPGRGRSTSTATILTPVACKAELASESV